MLRPRKTIDAAGIRAKLNGRQTAVRHEAKGAKGDPFDDAMIAAEAGVAQASKAETDALAEPHRPHGRDHSPGLVGIGRPGRRRRSALGETFNGLAR